MTKSKWSIMLKNMLVVLAISLSSCSYFTKKESGLQIARVFDRYLYSQDLIDVIPLGISAEDSISLANNYINNWIRQTLILHKAEMNLTDELKSFEQQLEDYRRSLIIYAYEKELVNQLLDTAVTTAEIERYYDNNKQNFELKDNIIKVLYLKVDKKAPNLKKVQKWYRSDDPSDLISLESYCHQFAHNFYLEDSNWLLFDDLLKEVPIVTYNKEDFLKQHHFLELEDNDFKYFVNIKGFKIKNSTSPLSFESENIRNIIINKRKLELITKMKNDIYDEAAAKNDFEVY